MKTAAALVALFYSVHWAFAAVMHARAVRDQLTLYWKVILYPLAAIGLALDVAFNVTFGTVVYAELPRELLFTTRCKRHRHGSGWRKSLADWACRNLNVMDPGHC